MEGSGFRLQVSGFGFRVSGFLFRVSGSGSWVSAFGVRVSGSCFGLRASGFEYLVSGFGFRGCTVKDNYLAKNVKQFRGGLVIMAHRLLCHPTLGSRVIKKRKNKVHRAAAKGHGRRSRVSGFGCTGSDLRF